MAGTRTLRIAGVQLTCRFGQRDDNLSRAADLAAHAALDGAQVIVFPELMPSGYSLSRRIWRYLEPPDGPSVRWLRATSARLGVYLGTTFAELDGGHMSNTFVLTGPDGTDVGRVRKTHTEAYLFRGDCGPHVIECALGRIGVGVCADNHYSDFARLMRRARPDLLLMPHAGPVACVVGGAVSETDIRRQHEIIGGIAEPYTRMLGAPVLFVNQCGPTVGRRGTGILGSVVDTAAFHFPGLTTIVDSDGRVLARLADEEGIACADVTVDPSRYPAREPVLHGAFAVSPRQRATRALYAVDGALGRAYYGWWRRRVTVAPENG